MNYSEKLSSIKEKHLLRFQSRFLNKKTLQKTTGRLWSIYRFVTIFCIGMILLFPVIYMISIILRPVEQMNDPMVVWVPKSVSFDTLIKTFQLMDYPKAFFETTKITLISSFLTIVSCSMAGYGFARFKIRFKGPLFMLVLLMLIVSPQNILIAMYQMYKNFDLFGIGSLVGLFTGKAVTVNLLGNELSMYLPAGLGSGIRSALYILIFTKFFSGLPKELEDAAQIDGCGQYKTFLKVMIPNAKSPLLVVFLFSVVWYWNDYYYTSVFMQNVTTLSSQLPRMEGLINALLRPAGSGMIMDPNELVAMLQASCLLTILPPLIMYIFLQKNFTESIERTGIVG